MKRYVMTMEMFIYADNDKMAKSQADYITSKQRKLWDNQAETSSLKRVDFGSLKAGDELIAN